MIFLRKFSFFNYLGGLMRAPINNRNYGQLELILFGYLIAAVGFYFGFMGGNEGALAVVAISTFLMFGGFSTSIYTSKTPNIASMMPISCKRELVYRFLAAFVMALFIFAVVAVVFIVISVITFLFALIPTCSGDAPEGGEVIEAITFKMGAYGGIFSAAYIVLAYSAGVLSTFFKRRRNRNIFFGVFSAALLLGLLCTALPYNLDPIYESAGLTMGSPFIGACYQVMGAPWLCVTLWCLVAAGTLGAAVYMGIKRIKENQSF